MLQDVLKKKVVKPAGRRQLSRYLVETYQFSECRSCRALPFHRSTVRYGSRARYQTPIRMRLRELAATRVRYGYRRLHVLLCREGWMVNHKRIWRLYKEEGLEVRTRTRCSMRRRIIPENMRRKKKNTKVLMRKTGVMGRPPIWK